MRESRAGEKRYRLPNTDWMNAIYENFVIFRYRIYMKIILCLNDYLIIVTKIKGLAPRFLNRGNRNGKKRVKRNPWGVISTQ